MSAGGATRKIYAHTRMDRTPLEIKFTGRGFTDCHLRVHSAAAVETALRSRCGRERSIGLRLLHALILTPVSHSRWLGFQARIGAHPLSVLPLPGGPLSARWVKSPRSARAGRKRGARPSRQLWSPNGPLIVRKTTDHCNVTNILCFP